mmetsp:Transcript_52508/g.92687  ORF Transcript_52508/g.92687 Transcript_52508/m.92687 type:complete len:107 (+) Transcript_52508:240-560(+)
MLGRIHDMVRVSDDTRPALLHRWRGGVIQVRADKNLHRVLRRAWLLGQAVEELLSSPSRPAGDFENDKRITCFEDPPQLRQRVTAPARRALFFRQSGDTLEDVRVV